MEVLGFRLSSTSMPGNTTGFSTPKRNADENPLLSVELAFCSETFYAWIVVSFSSPSLVPSCTVINAFDCAPDSSAAIAV